MNRFYTNVSVSGNQILYRGYENGKRKQFRVDYKPTLFAPSKDKSEWQSLDGIYVEKIQPGTIYDAREFIKKYNGVSGFKIYGDINAEYQFVSETFKGDVQYDFSSLKMATIDIETTAELGFPDVKDPQEKIIAITIRVKDEIWSFGLGQFSIG